MGTFIENNPTVIVAAVAAIAGIFYWAGSVRTDVNTLKKAIEEIRTDIKEILSKLSPNPTTGSSSPLELTDLGKDISEEIQALQWAKETAPALVNEVADKHPYEIQTFCLGYVRGNVLSENMQEKVKTSAYKRGLDKEQVLRVLAVELRDCLLSEDKA